MRAPILALAILLAGALGLRPALGENFGDPNERAAFERLISVTGWKPRGNVVRDGQRVRRLEFPGGRQVLVENPAALLAEIEKHGVPQYTDRNYAPSWRPRKVIVLLDLEPDDRISLKLLRAMYRPEEIAFIGTTVMHAGRKAELVRKALDQMGEGWNTIQVVQGTGGEGTAYPDITSSRAARNYNREGKGILPTDVLTRVDALPRSSQALKRKIRAYLKGLKENEDVEVALLAPPTDLAPVLKKNPKLRRKVGLIRWMLGWVPAANDPNELRATYNFNQDREHSQDLLDMGREIPMEVWSSHVIKPTFGKGGSINAEAYPKIMAAIDQTRGKPSMQDFGKANESWDHHLIEQIPPLGKIIGPYAGKQFTPADPLIPISMANPGLAVATTPVTITLHRELEPVDPNDLSKGYKPYRVTKSEDPNSKLRLVDVINPKEFERSMISAFDHLAIALPDVDPTKPQALGPVAYFSDAEGIAGKLEDFMAHSPGFFKGAEGEYHLKPGWRFVYGGDTNGRGPDEVKDIQTLLRLKAEAMALHPKAKRAYQSEEFVYFIGGNRDDNGVRLPTELSPEALLQPMPNADWPQWLRDQLVKEGREPASLTPEAAVKKYDGLVSRLKYKLAKTMGAPNRFEFRRRQLGGAQVPDVVVARSLLDDYGPKGILRQYLEHATPAVLLDGANGRKLLFTHSGITDENFLQVPTDKPHEFQKVGSLDEWVRGLTAWHRRQIAQWKTAVDAPRGSPLRYSGTGPRPAEALIAYVDRAPGQTTNPKSTAYGRSADPFNNFVWPGRAVLDHPELKNVDAFSGHEPPGPSAYLSRAPGENGARFGRVDNSYQPNEARAIVTTLWNDPAGTVSIETPLAETDAEGRPLRMSFSHRAGDRGPIGQRLPNGYVILGELAPGSVANGDPSKRYVAYRFYERFKGKVQMLSAEEVRRQGFGDAVAPCPGLSRLTGSASLGAR